MAMPRGPIRATNVRITRLDAEGKPTGEPFTVPDANFLGIEFPPEPDPWIAAIARAERKKGLLWLRDKVAVTRYEMGLDQVEPTPVDAVEALVFKMAETAASVRNMMESFNAAYRGSQR